MAARWVRKLDPITGRPLLRWDGPPVELYPVRPVESLLEEAPEELAPSQYCLCEWEEYIVVGAQDVTIVGGKRDKLGEKIFRFRFENQVG